MIPLLICVKHLLSGTQIIAERKEVLPFKPDIRFFEQKSPIRGAQNKIAKAISKNNADSAMLTKTILRHDGLNNVAREDSKFVHD